MGANMKVMWKGTPPVAASVYALNNQWKFLYIKCIAEIFTFDVNYQYYLM